MSCGCSLFIVWFKLLYLSKNCSPARIFDKSKLFPPPPSPLPPPLPHSCVRYAGLNSAHALLNTGLVFNVLLSCRWLFPFLLLSLLLLLLLLLLLSSLLSLVGCHRFVQILISDTVLDSWAFAPNTFYTHNLSKGNLSQNLSPYDLSPKRWASARAVGLQDSPFPWWPAEHAEGG